MADDLARKLSLLFLPAASAFKPCGWCPAADIYQVRGGWLLKFDLAGVQAGDIELSVQGRQLTIRGVRRDVAIEEGQRFYSMEISYERFERTLTLPAVVEGARLSTDYRDGLLLVRLLIGDAEHE